MSSKYLYVSVRKRESEEQRNLLVCLGTRGSGSLGQTAVDTSVVDQFGDQTGPTSLMGSAHTLTGVTVEELMEPNQILPVLILVESLVLAVASTVAIVILGEDVLETMLKLLGDVAKVHHVTRASRAFNLEVISVVHVEAEQRLYQQEVYTHPDRLQNVSRSKLTV